MMLGIKTTHKINDFIKSQANLDTLRFVTCGSVDDGKSTLIGRILFESQLIFDDQIDALHKDSKKIGTQGDQLDFALLVDGLASEREQGITIDVAYRFFTTDQRKFIVADSPGHEQYTRNMVTAASTSDAAVILIDARYGVLTQTKRHSIICSALGIQNVIVAINKMDLVNYQKDVFDRIFQSYHSFARLLDFKNINILPISALNGDNIIKPSKKMNWYKNLTLLGFLESIDPRASLINYPLRFPAQWINRPNSDFRGISGTVESGKTYVNQLIKVLPSGETAKIQTISLHKQKLQSAEAGQAITLTFDKEIDVSRGDIIVAADAPCNISNHFEVKIVWLDKEPGHAGRSYWLKLGTNIVNSNITKLKYKININNLNKLPSTKLELNDLCVINIKTDRPIPFEKFKKCQPLGAFLLLDRMNNKTVAAGMIEFSLRRSNNIHLHSFEIDKSARRNLNGHSSGVFWFTGISGSGKSTIAVALEKELHSQGLRTYILDGDNIRHGLNNDLGFTYADRVENIRRIGEVSKILVDAGIIVITAFISPFRAEREMVRDFFEDGEFIEIFVDTPLDVAERRDPKGLYKKARMGEIPNFTGIDSPYEIPIRPDFHIETEKTTIEIAVKNILKQFSFR